MNNNNNNYTSALTYILTKINPNELYAVLEKLGQNDIEALIGIKQLATAAIEKTIKRVS